MSGQSPKLLDWVRQAIRRDHHFIHTEEASINWKTVLVFIPPEGRYCWFNYVNKVSCLPKPS
jgi:hypothetical protein